MSRLALHIQHMKRGEVGAVDRHNRRSAETHSNEDIDSARSVLNIDLERPDGGLWSAVSEKVERVRSAGGRVTANSVVCSEWVVYPPEELQDPFAVDRDKLTSWGSDVLTWMRENGYAIEQAIIHLDETTVHMHVDSVPLTADGRLSRKDIYTRSALVSIHTELADHLSSCGWNIQRGEVTAGKGVKSKNTKEYKREQEKKVEQLEKRVEELQKALDPSERFSEIRVKESALGGSVKLSKDDFEALKSNAEAVGVLQMENDRLRQELASERQKVETYKRGAIEQKIKAAEAEKRHNQYLALVKRHEEMNAQLRLVDKLIMHLPSFLANPIALRELEKASGFSFKGYWDFKSQVQELRMEEALR